MLVQIEDGKVVESHLAIPSAEDVHILLIDHGRVAKSDLRFEQLIKLRSINLTLLDERSELSLFKLFCFDCAPAVRPDLIAVDVGEDVSFVAASINVKLI